jgi:hypothetical protein
MLNLVKINFLPAILHECGIIKVKHVTCEKALNIRRAGPFPWKAFFTISVL